MWDAAATSTAVLASGHSLPVSTTHTLVGVILGVALSKEIFKDGWNDFHIVVDCLASGRDFGDHLILHF